MDLGGLGINIPKVRATSDQRADEAKTMTTLCSES